MAIPTRRAASIISGSEVQMLRGIRVMIAVGALCAAGACSGLLPNAGAGDTSRSPGPPPRAWTAAVSFDMARTISVEFFDGRRTRTTSGAEGMEEALGRTPYYRLYVRDTLPTTFRVRVQHADGTATAVEYPMGMLRDTYYTIAVTIGTVEARTILGGTGFRSYPVPASAQRVPSDSLWIYWGGRARDCWTCPS